MEVVRTAGRASRYKVHYVGWNKGHDEILEKAKIIKSDADQSPQKGESDIIDLSENKSPATVIKVRQFLLNE